MQSQPPGFKATARRKPMQLLALPSDLVADEKTLHPKVSLMSYHHPDARCCSQLKISGHPSATKRQSTTSVCNPEGTRTGGKTSSNAVRAADGPGSRATPAGHQPPRAMAQKEGNKKHSSLSVRVQCSVSCSVILAQGIKTCSGTPGLHPARMHQVKEDQRIILKAEARTC